MTSFLKFQYDVKYIVFFMICSKSAFLAICILETSHFFLDYVPNVLCTRNCGSFNLATTSKSLMVFLNATKLLSPIYLAPSGTRGK